MESSPFFMFAEDIERRGEEVSAQSRSITLGGLRPLEEFAIKQFQIGNVLTHTRVWLVQPAY